MGCYLYTHSSYIGRYQKLRAILSQYEQSGNEELTYQTLVTNSNWARVYLMRKSKRQLEALKEHVCMDR